VAATAASGAGAVGAVDQTAKTIVNEKLKDVKVNRRVKANMDQLNETAVRSRIRLQTVQRVLPEKMLKRKLLRNTNHAAETVASQIVTTKAKEMPRNVKRRLSKWNRKVPRKTRREKMTMMEN
jgi:hypothetical protein